jgi:hypothetical protein
MIPIGFYSIDELMLQLNQIDGFTFSYDKRTLKITIKNINFFRVASKNGSPSNVNEILGFDDIITSTELTKEQTAPYLFNMSGIQMLNICLNNIQLTNTHLNNSANNYNILATIPVISTFGENQTFVNNSNFLYMIQDENISQISISIYDQDFNQVNFNNIDFFISLIFLNQYKKAFIQVEKLYDFHNNRDLANDLLTIEKNQLNKQLNV